jgi:hypothetical protein
VSDVARLALLGWLSLSALITVGWILAVEAYRKMAVLLARKHGETPAQLLIQFTHRQ